MAGQIWDTPPETVDRMISLAERVRRVHNGPVANEPGDVQDRLTYLNEVDKAFFSIGASIARTECECLEHRILPCSRCRLVEEHAKLRRSLKKLRENQ